MNRLVLIGNGFDLAHGLKTSYADFINWYIEKRYDQLLETHNDISEELLLTIKYQWHEAISTYISNAVRFNLTFGKLSKRQRMDWIMGNDDEFETTPSPLFERIIKGLESKTWGGIEQDYYDLLKEYALVKKDATKVKELNKQLHCLQELLIKYLIEIEQEKIGIHGEIKRAIYAPVETEDIAIGGKEKWESYVTSEINKDEQKLEYKAANYQISSGYLYDVQDYKKKPWNISSNKDYPDLARLPQQIMLINFNYTNTPERYLNREVATIVPIHGELDKPESIIFGYGDEIDPSFKELRDSNNGDSLKYVKSMRYLETPNYHNVLSFIESGPFQVLIMGHSCGNSDRTLLNTIFEHKNCVSIKPYYYITDKKKNTDNYIELVQHISRNFNDMKLMRDRVVNKTQCEPLVKE